MTAPRHRYPRHSTPSDIEKVRQEKANYVEPATRIWKPLQVKPHPRQADIDEFRKVRSLKI